MKKKTPAKGMKELRARRKAEGLVEFRVWCTPEMREKLRKVVEDEK